MSRSRNPHVSLSVTDKELSALVAALGRYSIHGRLREKLADAQKEMLSAKRLVNREAKMKRLGGDRTNRIAKEPESYPPDPVWGEDGPHRFHYTDYDGESLTLKYAHDGDIWADKLGEGPVYIRKEDIPVIVAAFENNHKEFH